MEKEVLVAVSYLNLKFYFNSEFSNIPEKLKKEIIESALYMANNLKSGFSIGFYENGEVYLETLVEDELIFDEINAEILIERFRKEKQEMLKSLMIYYKIFILQES